ncbi:MAG TPA: hypothetical protein VI259_16900 [Gemmatimonadaceae bacterium]
MHRNSRIGLLGTFTVCLACTHRPALTPAVTVSLSGNYRFVERPATMNEPIAGGVVIRGDTLIAVDDAGVCEYDKRASQYDNVIVYRCTTATLRFDRRDPIGTARYEATARVDSRQVICDERQRNCSRNRVENTTVSRPVSGVLHLKRIEEPR